VIARLIAGLLVPLLIAGLLWLAKDDMDQRSALAVARAQAIASAAAQKRAEDGETAARNTADKACSRQAVISLQAGRVIQGIVDAPAPASGRGMVTASDLAKVIGQ
jgi:hypothetical protein